ncbi:hypothetical protein Tco_0947961 [Tanacetum coccineum]
MFNPFDSVLLRGFGKDVIQGDPLGPLLFALVLHPLICKIRDSFSICIQAWYLDNDTIVGDTLVVGKDDPRSRLEGVFPPNIARPLHGVKLLGGLASVNFNFSSDLVMKRVAKTIGLVDAVSKINDPQCELFLLCACTSISKLYFAMRTCSPRVFEMAQRSFNAALRCALERIVTASGPGFGDWQWRLATLPFVFGGLGVYSAASRPTREDALCVFNTTMKIDLLSNPSVPLFSVSKPYSSCSRVFTGDLYGDHAVSCAGIIGRDKPLRPADMLLYSWDRGLDVCVDLTRSSPLTQTGLADFVPGQAVMDATHRKRVKYEAECADIEYGFLPFSFSSLEELEKDAMALLKQI